MKIKDQKEENQQLNQNQDKLKEKISSLQS